MPETPTPSLCHSVIHTLKTQMPPGCPFAYISVWRRQATALPVTSLHSLLCGSHRHPFNISIVAICCRPLSCSCPFHLSPPDQRALVSSSCAFTPSAGPPSRGEPQGRRFPSLALHSRPEPQSDSLATSWILFSVGFWRFPF